MLDNNNNNNVQAVYSVDFSAQSGIASNHHLVFPPNFVQGYTENDGKYISVLRAKLIFDHSVASSLIAESSLTVGSLLF